MANRAGLSPFICILAMLLVPAVARAADEPAATAAIPPPAPPVALHKPTPPREAKPKTAAVSHARPRHATAAKKTTRSAARAAAARTTDTVAERHARHRTIERRTVVVRSAPQRPANPPRDYAGVPMLAPDGPPPPMPPPWYDRARPAIAYAFPPPFMGPRGPMPWWVR